MLAPFARERFILYNCSGSVVLLFFILLDSETPTDFNEDPVCNQQYEQTSKYMRAQGIDFDSGCTRVCNQINTTGVTSGAGTAYPSGAPEFTPGF